MICIIHPSHNWLVSFKLSCIFLLIYTISIYYFCLSHLFVLLFIIRYVCLHFCLITKVTIPLWSSLMDQENLIVHTTPLDDDNTIKEHLLNEPLHLDSETWPFERSSYHAIKLPRTLQESVQATIESLQWLESLSPI